MLARTTGVSSRYCQSVPVPTTVREPSAYSTVSSARTHLGFVHRHHADR